MEPNAAPTLARSRTFTAPSLLMSPKSPMYSNVMVTFCTDPLWYIVREVELAEMVNSGFGFTASEILTEWTSPPLLVPPIVIVKLPSAAVEVAVNVTFGEHVGLQLEGVKTAVRPEGRLDTVKLTDRVSPEVRVAIIVADMLPPWSIVPLPGGMERVKSKRTRMKAPVLLPWLVSPV